MTEDPGVSPRSPLSNVAPVLVTSEAPMTAKDEANPRFCALTEPAKAKAQVKNLRDIVLIESFLMPSTAARSSCVL